MQRGKKNKDNKIANTKNGPPQSSLKTYITRAQKVKSKMADDQETENGNGNNPVPQDPTDIQQSAASSSGTVSEPIHIVEVGDSQNTEDINTLNVQPNVTTNPGNHSNTGQSGLPAEQAGSSQSQEQGALIMPTLEFAKDNPEMNIILKAIDNKLDFILLDNSAWKKKVDENLIKLNQDVGTNKTDIEGMKGVVDYMERVAKRSNAQSDSISQTTEQIFAQLEIDRLGALRREIALEDRLNALEREHRAYNIRVQGLTPTPTTNLRKLIVDTFSKVVPNLELANLEYVAKIVASKKKATSEGEEQDALPQASATKRAEPSVILLVRFNDKSIRNKVYALARKNKEKLPKNLVVREDMIKVDYDTWSLAKPQMETAHKGKKMCRYRYGRLIVNSENVPIEGLLSTNERIHEMNEGAKIPITIPQIPALEDIP